MHLRTWRSGFAARTLRTTGIGRHVAVAAVIGLGVFGAGTAIAGQGRVVAPSSYVENTELPAISGTPTVGNALSCSTGSWKTTLLLFTADGWTYDYQWQRNGADIPGATTSSYTVLGDDVSAQITCRVTASFPDATPASATSAPVTGLAAPSSDPGTGSAPVALPSASKIVQLPSNKRCLSKRSFKIHVRQIAGVTYLKVEVYVNGEKVKTVTGDRITAPVNLTGLPKDRFAAKIVVTTTDGRTLTHSRKYRTCSKRRPGKKHPL